MKRFVILLALLSCPLAAARAGMQSPPQPPEAPKVEEDQGIPVTSDLVKRKCSSCHKSDEKGRLTRISYRRTTPEGWEETIKRMISLNGLKIEPAEARDVLRYLADHQGLAPEEARPAAFEVERRMIEYKYATDKEQEKKETEQTCSACHSMGRVISQRRTKEEWELLVAMHRGYYWRSDDQAFRRIEPPPRDAPPPPDGRPPDNRHPMDKAIAHLASAFPLNTPEWSAWAATMRPPQIQGTWALSGAQPGKGPVFGRVVIAAQGDANSGEYTTDATFVYARTGETVKRHGRAIVYAGFQWRGRSEGGGAAGDSAWREVLFIDRDWRRADGRWFTGAYDEFGIDVKLQHMGADPILSGVAQSMIRAGANGQELTLYGANLPQRVSPGDLNFGPGVTVDRIVNAVADRITMSVSVEKNATPGRRAVFLAGATGDVTVGVYDTIDFIKISPQAGLARVGGANFPKQFQQFEAIAYANGPDGKPDTKDDIELGAVEAKWSIEEYTATYDDDDKEFVGTIDPSTGLFTPNLDGPNPKRRHGTNNYGDVWAVATIQAPGPSGERPIKGRAHLLVTVPLYIKFDQPEVAR